MIELPALAYVLVKMKPGTSQEIVASRKIRGVKMAHSVLGRYDAVLVVTAEDLKALSKNIYNIIEKHPNVVRTETLLAFFYPPEAERPKVAEDVSHVISHHCPSCHSLIEVGSLFCHFCGFKLKEK